MDNNNTHDDIHRVDWDDDTDMMAAVVLIIVNNNTEIMNRITHAHQEQQLIQLMNDILMPNQAYRHQPRQFILSP
jgi:hypothetical protein